MVAAILRTQLTGSVASRRWLASQPTNANAAFRLLCVCATVLCLFVQYKLSAWRCDLFVELSACKKRETQRALHSVVKRAKSGKELRGKN